MYKKIIIIFIIFFLLLSPNVVYGKFYNFSSGALKINQKNCITPYVGMTIREDTIICSGSWDMSTPITYEAIKIDEDNITLSCEDGTVLRGGGNQPVALRIYNGKNITVNNCTFEDFGGGVYTTSGSENITISNNKFIRIGTTSNVTHGKPISLADTNKSNIINNLIDNQHVSLANGAIAVSGGDYNTIRGNKIKNVVGETFRNHGIVFYSLEEEGLADLPRNNKVIDNTLTDIQGDSILIVGENNIASGNYIDNLGITSCVHSEGIHVENEAKNTILENNKILNSCQNGIEITSSYYTVIRNNEIKNSRLQGIMIDGVDSSDTFIERCLIEFSGGFDIYHRSNKLTKVIDTQFQRSKVETGAIDFYSNFRIRTLDAKYNQPLINSKVYVYNKGGGLVMQTRTNREGFTRYYPIFIKRKTSNGYTQIKQSELDIYARNNSYFGKVTTIANYPNKTVEIALDDVGQVQSPRVINKSIKQINKFTNKSGNLKSVFYRR